MELYLEDEVDFFKDQKELLEKVKEVILSCGQEEKIPYDFEVSFTVVDGKSIREINKMYREMDKETDVLSFPQIDFEENFSWETMDKLGNQNLENGLLILGDIILCSDKAKEQAQAYGHSLEREVCFLVAHSMFHLLGYDHQNPEEEENMIKKQEKVLQKLNITR